MGGVDFVSDGDTSGGLFPTLATLPLRPLANRGRLVKRLHCEGEAVLGKGDGALWPESRDSPEQALYREAEGLIE